MRFQRLCKACVCSLLTVLAGLIGDCCLAADEPAAKTKEELIKSIAKLGSEAKKTLPEWDKVVEGATRMEGLFPLYYNAKEQKLFMEVQQTQYDKEMILPMAIARGAGMMYLGGDDAEFRRPMADLFPSGRPIGCW